MAEAAIGPRIASSGAIPMSHVQPNPPSCVVSRPRLRQAAWSCGDHVDIGLRRTAALRKGGVESVDRIAQAKRFGQKSFRERRLVVAKALQPHRCRAVEHGCELRPGQEIGGVLQIISKARGVATRCSIGEVERQHPADQRQGAGARTGLVGGHAHRAMRVCKSPVSSMVSRHPACPERATALGGEPGLYAIGRCGARLRMPKRLVSPDRR